MLHGCASPLMFEAALCGPRFTHQSEAQPPNGPLTAATSPDTPSLFCKLIKAPAAIPITACRRAISSFTSNLRRFNSAIWSLSVEGCARASTISRSQRPMAPLQFRKMRCSGHIGRSPS